MTGLWWLGLLLAGPQSGLATRPALVVFGNIVPWSQERAKQCSEHSWARSGHVATISMLRLNIGSGKLSSCMLSIGLGPKCEQGKGERPPQVWPRGYVATTWLRGLCLPSHAVLPLSLLATALPHSASFL